VLSRLIIGLPKGDAAPVAADPAALLLLPGCLLTGRVELAAVGHLSAVLYSSQSSSLLQAEAGHRFGQH